MGVIQEIFYRMPHSLSLGLSLHHTSLKENVKFQKYQKKITWHHHCAFHKNLAHWLPVVRVHFYLFSFYSPKSIAVVLHRYRYAKIESHSANVKYKTNQACKHLLHNKELVYQLRMQLISQYEK